MPLSKSARRALASWLPASPEEKVLVVLNRPLKSTMSSLRRRKFTAPVDAAGKTWRRTVRPGMPRRRTAEGHTNGTLPAFFWRLGTDSMKCAKRRFVEDAWRLDLGAVLRSCRAMTATPAARWSASPGAAAVGAVVVPVSRRGVPVGQIVLDVLRTGRRGEVQIVGGLGCGTVAEIRADAAPLVGYRWTFECPVTGQRCRSLFLPPGAAGFASSAAHGLAYAVTCERPAARRCRRAVKLRRALGEVPVVVSGPLPDRPAEMRGGTYLRRCAEIEAVERLLEIA
jgi:hypothetical protein